MCNKQPSIVTVKCISEESVNVGLQYEIYVNFLKSFQRKVMIIQRMAKRRYYYMYNENIMTKMSYGTWISISMSRQNKMINKKFMLNVTCYKVRYMYTHTFYTVLNGLHFQELG